MLLIASFDSFSLFYPHEYSVTVSANEVVIVVVFKRAKRFIYAVELTNTQMTRLKLCL